MRLLYISIIIISVFLTACGSDNDKKKVVTVADVGGTPDGVTVTDTGNIIITDIGTGEIKHVEEDGTVTVVEDPSSDVTIDHPDGITAVTTDNSEILYVADTGSSTGDLSTDGTIVKIEIGSDGTVTTSEFVDSTVIDNPTGVAADDSGNLYVADQNTGDIYRITVTGGIPGSPESLTDSLPAGVDIDEPHGLALVQNEDNSVTLYTTDQGTDSNNIVRIDIPVSGAIADVVVTELTTDNSGGIDTGTTDTAKFDKPHGISVDQNGVVFVCDENNNRVQVITPSGNVNTIAGNGTSGDTVGDIEDAQFNLPRGLCVDGNGDLLVCDYGNGKVKKIER